MKRSAKICILAGQLSKHLFLLKVSSSSTSTFEFWLDKFFSCFSPESSFEPSFNSVASTSSTGQRHCRADLGRGMRPLSASRSSFFPCATVNLFFCMFHLLSDLLASLLFLQQESRSQGEVQRKRTRVANCLKIANTPRTHFYPLRHSEITCCSTRQE